MKAKETKFNIIIQLLKLIGGVIVIILLYAILQKI